MRICLMIEGQEGVSWEQWVGLAKAGEEHGFEGLFRSDHYLSFSDPSTLGTLDAWATIAALSGHTERLRLGTLVSPVTFRHPANLAKSVVTADHASGGRVEVGMGAGWFDAEHRAYGFPFPPVAERFRMLQEQVEIVHRLLNPDEPAVTFHGEHYRLDECPPLPKPVQKPHPPLIIGGQGGPRSRRLAVRWADEYNVNFVEPAECRRRREALTGSCEEAGRDPGTLPLSVMTGCLVGADRGDLESRGAKLMQKRGQNGDPAAFVDGLGGAWLAGTPDQVLARLGEYSAAGVYRIMLQDLLHEDLEMVALIGQEVIPEAASL
jgi:F420-dependent oxidoreductase-like protein